MKLTRLAAVVWVVALAAGCSPASEGPGDGGTPVAVQTDGATPPLVIVSFDGFRWDYPDRIETPNLDRLEAAGVRAERLIPVFPSKTFPGHYSVVTGLYPGHHGIVSNNMRDPRWDEVFGLGNRAEVENGRWWGGEPIWVTAMQAGLRAAVYFWPGSEAPIKGQQPDWWYPFDDSVPYEERVDQALDWLALPAPERPQLVALYFGEPNDSGHRYGPDADETAAAVRRADAALGRLLDGLEARGLVVNIMVSSDHGMAQNDPERVILLDDFADLREGELFEFGAFVQVYPEAGRAEMLFEQLEGAHPNLAVYRQPYPEHLHLHGNPRVAPIIAVPDAGWEAVPRLAAETNWGGRGLIPGNHGQDPKHPDMHGIFYAMGPDIAGNPDLGAVEQVDLYNLMCRLLGIEPATNDGVWERVEGALRAGR
jgi:predicted AlkP superfamily pyrophosphatase or phosphodiesterase